MGKYVSRKFDGDDDYSYAIFKLEDVKHLGKQIFYGDASPVLSGLNKSSAQYERDLLNKKGEK